MNKQIEKTYIFSDLFNAQIFYEMFKDEALWCPKLGGWYIFDGKCWILDNSSNIDRKSIEAFHELSRRMKVIDTQESVSHTKRSASNAALKAMVERSKSFLGVSPEIFDSHKYLINCNNGEYSLQDSILLKHSPNDYLTKKANVEYKQEVDCPLWKAFIEKICLGRIDLMRFIQKMIGYGITDETKEQCIFILYGHGSNGKSTLMDTIEAIMGDFCKRLPSDILIEKGSHVVQQTNDIARLKGARIVLSSESEQNVTLSEKLIKAVTGDKRIMARFLYQESFEFEPTFKIFLSTNNKPNVRGTDNGIWRRIRMIPFDLKLEKHELDRDLFVKLKSEYSGIFNWIIEGYKMYCEEGLEPPKDISQATELYREEEDDIGQFIEDYCILEKGAFIPANTFREEFKKQMGYYKGRKVLSEYMGRIGCKSTGDTRIVYQGKQQRGYINIRLATEMDKIKDEGWKD